MKNHEKAFSDIKNYYNDITLNNLALINSLKVRTSLSLSLSLFSRQIKGIDPCWSYIIIILIYTSYPILFVQEQVEKMKKDGERLEKQLAETQAENRRLQEPLQKAREEVAELQKQLANYERDKVSLTVSAK